MLVKLTFKTFQTKALIGEIEHLVKKINQTDVRIFLYEEKLFLRRRFHNSTLGHIASSDMSKQSNQVPVQFEF